MNNCFDFIIIGACQAGLTASEVLRSEQPEHSILLINGEDRLPYKRTHLTKKLSAGFETDDFAIHPPEWYRKNRIELSTGYIVDSINAELKIIKLSNGRKVRYGKLLIATGSRPRKLSIPGIEHARHLRTASDTESIMAELLNRQKIIVLGQGIEGVEIAEQCAKIGKEVTIVGVDERLMQRTLDVSLSDRLLKLFSEHKVECRFRSRAVKIVKTPGGLSLISDTGRLEADMIISSTGIRANNRLTEALGVNGYDGIITDEYYQTSVEGIFAAGDVLQLPQGWTGGLWHSAQHQGENAAKNMSGSPVLRKDYQVRTKCEVFDDFLFSMGFGKVRGTDIVSGWSDDIFLDNDGHYLKMFSRDGRVIAALLAGMKEKAKLLQQAVAAALSPEEIRSLMN